MLKVLGTSLGFVGLCFLLIPYIKEGNSASILGIVLVSIAAASYGWAAVYTKRKLAGLKPLIAPAYQLLMASVILVPIYSITSRPSQLINVASSFWIAIACLGFFGTAMAYIVYFKIIERADASFLTLVTYLIPVISVLLGTVFLNEKLYWNVYVGAALIVTGLISANAKLKVAQLNT
jgi:drug/metabolite transporter (DMT)-like permease